MVTFNGKPECLWADRKPKRFSANGETAEISGVVVKGKAKPFFSRKLIK
jgi:hypothetical protein